MIFPDSLLMHILSVLTILGIARRLKQFLDYSFEPTYSILIVAAILFHPLSIDAFLVPNVLNGSVAFWLFIESMFCMKENKIGLGFSFIFLAAVCNISYALTPLYYFVKLPSDVRKKLVISALIYFLLLSLYSFKLMLLAPHNILTFFSYFFQIYLLPVGVSVFTPSLYAFSITATAMSAIIFLLLVGADLKKKTKDSYWPFLILPLFGVVIHQWTGAYKFWSEVIFAGSNYLCMTFALTIMIATHVPKKIFAAFVVLMVAASINWGMQFHPYSNVLRQSILNLPDDYKESALAKRTLAWQYLYEDKFIEGRSYLEELAREYSDNELFKKDLELLRKGTLWP